MRPHTNVDDVIGRLQAAAAAEFGDALQREATALQDLTAATASLAHVEGDSFASVAVADHVGVDDRVDRTGSLSAESGEIVTRTRAAIQRARELNPRLNAFTVIDEPSALAAAVASQRRHDEGRTRGPLDGMIVAHKDLFDREGQRSTFGSRIHQSRPAQRTAEVIRRLADAGTISIGALTMAEFALGPTGHNATFGHCRNPWNTARVSGGSSSGSASAVAAGIVSGALGTDTGGSIRTPASCCGVVGLKPTQGRVSAANVLPLSRSLDCVGPIARTARDCALLFDAMVDADPADEDRAVVISSATEARGPFTIAYSQAAIARSADACIAAAVNEAAAVFRTLGDTLVERPLPDMARLHSLADIIQRSEAASVHAATLSAHRHAYTRHVVRRIEGGLFVAAPAYISALQQRSSHLRHFIETTLRDADAVLLPTVGFPIPLIDETDEEELGPLPDLVGSMTRWTRWLNYLGVPALSVPCGQDGNGMPIGMQLVGRPGSEFRLLLLAARFESVTAWHRRCAALMSAEL